jgi:hypothetical protein
MSVILVVEGTKAEYRGTTVDVSPHGLRLLSDATLALDQRVRLHLSADPTYVVKARVTWADKTDSAKAGQAGFQFLDLVPGLEC